MLKTANVIMACLIYILQPSSGHAASVLRLNCPERAMMTVTRFNYGLTTLEWAERHFQVAAGVKRNKTAEGSPFRAISFRNGDDLVYLPEKHLHIFFYANRDKPVVCEDIDTFTTHAIKLPRYH
ncbi:hypothetical protein [Serratia rhizosphaerae]|uniref:Uncharacterized protein n=1 Tax=Serratia rhizosphaerae TaxID=2597702 RepID=A0ABX6GHE9_9GAMM|nr:hypothetical protein [Serratia rhizosphaerae]MEB6335631.1 hypothetical protein [Serratia rhizosphaerae]QHA85664.1 hypothetical protein FO014_00970 [Serratia rhizosphaerae]